MKRLGRLWDKIYDEENGILAVINGTKNKRGNPETKPLLYSDEDVALNPAHYHQIDPEKARIYVNKKLLPGLRNLTWKPKSPNYKRTFSRNRTHQGGKWRDYWVPYYDDHIIAHMLMQVAMPAFTRGMHPHTCGSVPGRGINHIIKTVKKWTQKDPEARYFVKLDIRHFYENIDADRLIEILKTKIKDKYVLWAFEQLIRCSPMACATGFYTSPYFSNLYLEKLDWFIEQDLYKVRRGKRIKLVKHNLRYIDDILLFGSSKSDLRKAVQAIKDFLFKMDLEIKDSWEIKRIGEHVEVDGEWKLVKDTCWCDIGGYKFCRDAVIMRDGIFLAASRLARQIARRKTFSLHNCQSLSSRIGWASHTNCRYFIEGFIEPYVDISKIKKIISSAAKKKRQIQMPLIC